MKGSYAHELLFSLPHYAEERTLNKLLPQAYQEISESGNPGPISK